MYAMIGGNRYPAKKPQQSKPYGTWWRVTLTDRPDVDVPVSGMVSLYGDDGTELVSVYTADYARQTYKGGVLTLTNQPEPQPAAEPTEEQIAAELASLKENRVQESKILLTQFLAEHPLTWVDGNTYSVTEEKQSLLTSQLALQTIADAAGIERELKWNTTGGVCTTWTAESLSALALAIGAYVQPLVTYQQTVEVAINACETAAEAEVVEIDYYTVYPELRPVREELAEPETAENETTESVAE